MKDQKNAGYPTENTSLSPIQPEKPFEESKLRHLTDEEIIRGFRYLMSKDKKDKLRCDEGKRTGGLHDR